MGATSDLDFRLVPDHAGQHAEREALLAELGKLPRRQRAVLVLRYYEGFSDAEIAELFGCTPGTVRGYASRLDGRRVIELTWQDGPGSRSYLWVDASTYLPIREEAFSQEGSPGHWTTVTVRDDYELLAATQANLAKLTTQIPAGFRRTAHQVLPYSGPGLG